MTASQTAIAASNTAGHGSLDASMARYGAGRALGPQCNEQTSDQLIDEPASLARNCLLHRWSNNFEWLQSKAKTSKAK
jgi:hypothetical protein